MTAQPPEVQLFFHGWDSLGRVVLIAAAVYVIVVAALRVIGSRALAKMSAYDLVVSVAIGSLVASVPLTESISLADGVAVMATFLGLQELTRFLQARYRTAHHLVRERPHLVVWDGNIVEDRLRQIDSSADEVRAAVRRAGLLSMSDVQAVVLENDGEWSVMPRADARDLSALEGLDVPGHGPVENGDGPRPRRDGSGSHRQPPATAGIP